MNNEGQKASDLLLESAGPFDRACILVRKMESDNTRFIKALKLIASRSRCNCFKMQEDTSSSSMFHPKPTLAMPLEFVGCAIHNSEDREEWCMTCEAKQALIDAGIIEN